MSFPRYPKYKDSGVEWLGEVPEHWGILPIKRIVAVPITDGPHETPQFLDEGVPFVSAEAISSGRIDFSKIRACISPEDNARYSIKYSPMLHDIFMVKSGATTGITAIVEDHTNFNIWSPLAVIRCGSAAAPRFVLNFMRSRNFIEAITLNWSFGTQQNIGMGVIENLACTIPPLPEQTRIAAFLDRETAKIDGLVAEQQRLIDLLKEKRQAVISHAVTKGLNPAAPMKPSGIEWLGDVPAHWDVRRISSLCTKITNGYVGPTRDIFVDDGVRYLQSLHIKSNQIIFDTPYHVSREWSDQHAKSILETGDVLIVQTGDIGQAAVVTDEFAGCNCHALIVVAPVRSIVDGEWIAWALNSEYGLHTLLSIQTGALHPHLNCGDVKDVALPLPPMREQQNIVSHIKERSRTFDALTAEAQRAIDLLHERRTALISAAVTGQIDVRHFTAAGAA
jgi:type I restriction enzyme, S subunit